MSRVLILLLRSHLRVLCGVASSKINCDVRQFMFSQVATPRAAIREGDTTQGLSFMYSDLNQEPPLSKKLANMQFRLLRVLCEFHLGGHSGHDKQCVWLFYIQIEPPHPPGPWITWKEQHGYCLLCFPQFFFFHWVEIFSARKTLNGRDLRAVVLKLSKQGPSITFLPLEPIFEYLFFKKKKHKWTAMLHVL